jgi:hypothetical protein
MALKYTIVSGFGRFFVNILVATAFGQKGGFSPEPCGSGENP